MENTYSSEARVAPAIINQLLDDAECVVRSVTVGEVWAPISARLSQKWALGAIALVWSANQAGLHSRVRSNLLDLRNQVSQLRACLADVRGPA